MIITWLIRPFLSSSVIISSSLFGKDCRYLPFKITSVGLSAGMRWSVDDWKPASITRLSRYQVGNPHPRFAPSGLITHPLRGYHVCGYLMRYHSRDSQEVQRVEFSIKDYGGGRIRTHGRTYTPAVFKTAALNHSATPPVLRFFFLLGTQSPVAHAQTSLVARW